MTHYEKLMYDALRPFANLLDDPLEVPRDALNEFGQIELWVSPDDVFAAQKAMAELNCPSSRTKPATTLSEPLQEVHGTADENAPGVSMSMWLPGPRRTSLRGPARGADALPTDAVRIGGVFA